MEFAQLQIHCPKSAARACRKDKGDITHIRLAIVALARKMRYVPRTRKQLQAWEKPQLRSKRVLLSVLCESVMLMGIAAYTADKEPCCTRKFTND